MLVQINRNIFKYLSEELRKTYVYDMVCAESNEKLDYEEEAQVTDAIIQVINNNEEWHEKYGVIQKNGLKQVTEECMVPAWSGTTGYYQVGKILIAGFDWSWDDNGDFDYSFSLYYSLEHCRDKS